MEKEKKNIDKFWPERWKRLWKGHCVTAQLLKKFQVEVLILCQVNKFCDSMVEDFENIVSME